MQKSITFSDALCEMEAEFHHAFLKNRIDMEDYVYVENSELYRQLDEHCDIDNMHSPKGPLIVYGDAGSGKSALLANWITRRKKHFQTWNSSFTEFIFYHAVGCSRQGIYVSKLLERILSEIKDFFELSKEVPTVEERLSWQFPRFLEAASRKGRVLLIIDGLHRLRTTDGDGILKWIPLSFPPNIRLIFTGTLCNSAYLTVSLTGKFVVANSSKETDESSTKKNLTIDRIQIEAKRRNWSTVFVQQLKQTEKLKIIEKYLLKLQRGKSEFELNKSLNLRLFDIQKQAIVSMPQTSNPYFLKIFLTCLSMVALKGYNIHSILSDWINTKSVSHLYEAVLRSLEAGYQPSSQQCEDSKSFLEEHFFVPSTEISFKNKVEKRQIREESQGWEKEADDSPYSDDGSDNVDEEMEVVANSTLESLTYVEESAVENNLRLNSEQEVLKESNEKVEENGMTHTGRNECKNELTDSNADNEDYNKENEYSDDEGYDDDDFDEDEFEEATVDQKSEHGLENEISDENLSAKEDNQKVVRKDNIVECVTVITPSVKEQHVTSTRTDEGSSATSHTKINSALRSSRISVFGKDSIEYPAFLLGGNIVTGLQHILGHALSLLYVCRHGLHTNELKHLVIAIIDSEQDNVTPETDVDENEENLYHMLKLKDSKKSKSSLKESDWNSLLLCLKYLGVIFIHRILVLPMCYESLRDTILWRYIGSESTEMKYHQWIIRYFSNYPPSFRKIEELPWHYEFCNRWTSLKDILVNISVFQLMYTTAFKNELFSFWQTLSDHSSSLKTANRDTECNSNGLAPFDIVREYNKSIEDWCSNSSPKTNAITSLVLVISKFLYEYSHFNQLVLPNFKHPKLDLNALTNDGFPLDDLLPQLTYSESSTFYFYQRWIWIQFPWFLISCDSYGLSSNNNDKKDQSKTLDEVQNTSNGNTPNKVKSFTQKCSLLSMTDTVSNNDSQKGQKKKKEIVSSPSLPSLSTDTMGIIGPNSRGNKLLRRQSSTHALKHIPMASNVKHSIQMKTNLKSVGEKVTPISPITALSGMKESTWDIKKSYNYEILYKLQQTHNSLKTQVEAKSIHLEKLRQEIKVRKLQRQMVVKNIKEGDFAMKEMSLRMEKIVQAKEKVETQGIIYKKILVLCDKFPAGDSNHLSMMKKELSLLQNQYNDVRKQLAALQFEKQHFETTELPNLSLEFQKSKFLHGKLINRLEKTKKRISFDNSKIQELSEKRAGIIEDVKTRIHDLSKKQEKQLEMSVNTEKAAASDLNSKSILVKSSLHQFDTVRSILHIATGATDLHAVFQKFMNREELNQGLEEQSIIFEERLRQMRANQFDIEQELKSLESIQSLKVSDDARLLEDTARERDSRLSRGEERHDNLSVSWKEIMLGVSNIAMLLGIVNETEPRKDVIPIEQLWPPVRKLQKCDNERSFDLSLLSSDKMAEIIHVCEDRANAIIESLENGRSHPDKNFETVAIENEGSSQAKNNIKNTRKRCVFSKELGHSMKDLNIANDISTSNNIGGSHVEDSLSTDLTPAMHAILLMEKKPPSEKGKLTKQKRAAQKYAQTGDKPLGNIKAPFAARKLKALMRGDSNEMLVTRESIKQTCKQKLLSRKKTPNFPDSGSNCEL